MDRAIWQFALVGIAVAIETGDGGVVDAARLVASGIGPAPHVLGEAAGRLVGRTLDDESVSDAANASAIGLEPLSENAYKVPLLAGFVRRSLMWLVE